LELGRVAVLFKFADRFGRALLPVGSVRGLLSKLPPGGAAGQHEGDRKTSAGI
jgi:hypothetical protein